MRVTFWGTRGSIATPGRATVRFGGNTSCVEVRTDAGTVVVLDCGTGARPLGEAILAESDRTGTPGRGHVLIGHTHWDHIQGLPFFAPLFQPGANWHVYGPRGLGQSVASTLAGQMNHLYFPVSLEQLEAEISYHDLVEGTLEFGDLAVQTQYLNHPALTLGYRLEADGVTVAYITDHEPFDAELAGGGDLKSSLDDARHLRFLEGADLIIHDSQYTAAEYPAKRGWGHSTIEYAVAAARQAGAQHLVLFHHDPSRDDAALDRLQSAAQATMGQAVKVTAAAEGETIELTPQRSLDHHATAALSALFNLSGDDPVRSLLLAVRDGALAGVIRSAALAGHLSVRDLPDDGESVGTSSLVVLDHDEPGSDELLERLEKTSSAGLPPVLAVTRRRPPLAGLGPVSDWLVWPATINHVRAKLQAAVLGRMCQWQNAPAPREEEARLAALTRLHVLDTPRDERFDRLTRLARQKLRVPVALVTLVDRDRQWFKSVDGLDLTETPRDESICAHAILSDDVMQVPDLLLDRRFAELPAVAGPPRVRFYAGAPLILDGYRVGTLCVVDYRPRVLSDAEVQELRELSVEVAAELLVTATPG